ncbi:peptidase [Naegleria gruberi]|uniref:Peptidase n=1 Tax=Naegleria gruberi TaxID=5762 RepID=D2VQG2_NAEGR|nr:peptidase [Naegleria gruberi]EFC40868.1 peptidase [Naegleria gruberi]|eukprot:XP_002673612.1 peptidase [Naegleria gruberi]
MSDPSDFPGMAHFVEHMTFISSKKYPIEGEYKDFLKKRGGATNASTSAEKTTYYFTISNDYLEEALDRFAQFFISPTFSEHQINREVEAINSEFKKNLQLEERRLYQLMKNSSNPLHPFRKFGTGNTISLKTEPEMKNLNSREHMIEFFEKYYSSNQMKLSIIGNYPFEILEQWARNSFSEIRNNNMQTYKYYPSSVEPFNNENLARLYKYIPISDSPVLTIMFPINISYPVEEMGRNMYYKQSSITMLNNLLGHEGKGSLYSKFRAEGLAQSVESYYYSYGGVSDPNTSFYFLIVKVELTKKGEDKWQSMIEDIFEYISMLKKDGIPKYFFDELSQMKKLAFENAQFTSTHASNLASSLQLHLPHEVISANYLIYELDEVDISNVLGQLHAENMNIYICSKSFAQDELKHTERWYDIKYSTDRLDFDFLNLLKMSKINCSKELHLPPQNIYVPYNLELVEEESTVYPEKIVDADTIRTWFKKDDYFKTPRGDIIANIIVPQSYSDPSNAVMVQLFCDMVQYSLNEELYMIKLAKISTEIEMNKRGLAISTSGFSNHLEDVIYVMLREIVHMFDNVDTCFTEKMFDYIKENNVRYYQNQKFKRQPYQFASSEYINFSLRAFDYSYEEFANALEKITLEQFKGFVKFWSLTMTVECLIHGNFKKDLAMRLSDNITRILFEERNKRPMTPLPCQDLLTNVAIYPPNKDLALVIPNPNETNENSAILSCFHIGPRCMRMDCILELFAQVSSSKYFQYMRTENQFGYIVSSYQQMIHNASFFACVVQTVKDDLYHIFHENDLFFEKFGNHLEEITDEKFTEIIESIISKNLEKEKTMAQRSSRYDIEIYRKQYRFDRYQLKAEEFKTITKDDLINFYRDYILKSGKNFARASFIVTKKDLIITFPEEKNIELVRNKENFKLGLSYHPHFIYY